MSTYETKLLRPLYGTFSTSCVVPVANNEGSLVESRIVDDGLLLTYRGNEVLDKRTRRNKSEVYYNNLSIQLTAGAQYNLVSLIKGITPIYGTLSPFFDTTGDRLIVINDDASCSFKLNVIGNWANASGNRSLKIDFLGTAGNSLVANRSSDTVGDSLTLATFLSVDKGGNLATNGSVLKLSAVGINFTITSILLIAEQVTKESF